jgi:molybdopterin-containing oxidoreductase family iron-sulfur binding subunit
LKDADSQVSQRRRSDRHYVLLEELGTRPRTTYLARWNDEPDEGGGR